MQLNPERFANFNVEWCEFWNHQVSTSKFIGNFLQVFSFVNFWSVVNTCWSSNFVIWLVFIFVKKYLMGFNCLSYGSIEVKSVIKTIRGVLTVDFALKFVWWLCLRCWSWTKSIMRFETMKFDQRFNMLFSKNFLWTNYLLGCKLYGWSGRDFHASSFEIATFEKFLPDIAFGCFETRSLHSNVIIKLIFNWLLISKNFLCVYFFFWQPFSKL